MKKEFRFQKQKIGYDTYTGIGPWFRIPIPKPGFGRTLQQPKKKLTVIAKHRRLGEESLSKLKEEVRKYALDHTFKETAKKFGIHHSTVSGWVKARERGGGLGLLKCKTPQLHIFRPSRTFQRF